VKRKPKIKNSRTAKLKNRRVALVHTTEGYTIFAKSLFRNWEGKPGILKSSLALSDEAMQEVALMRLCMETEEGRHHVWVED
jgi:hypothetical protein